MAAVDSLDWQANATQVISQLSFMIAHADVKHTEIVAPIQSLTKSLEGVDSVPWSSRVEDLVLALKAYVTFYDRIFASAEVSEPEDPKIFVQKTTMGLNLSKLACEALSGICNLMPPKDAYSFFSSFILKQGPGTFSLMEIFKLKHVDVQQRTSPYIDYDAVLQVLLIAVKKAQPTLSFAESKNVRNRPATYTAFSMTIAFALEEILSTLIAVIDQSLPRIDRSMVCDVLVLVAQSCPFHRLHRSVFHNLVSFCSRQLCASPPKIHRRYTLELCILCVDQSTKFTEEEIGMLFERVQPTRFSPASEYPEVIPDGIRLASITSKSLGQLQYWMSCAINDTEDLQVVSDVALLDIQLLISLTKNYFQHHMPDSVNFLKAAIHILSELSAVFRGKTHRSNPAIRFRVIVQLLLYIEELASAVSRYVSECELLDEDFLSEFVNTWDQFFEMVPKIMSIEGSHIIPLGAADCFAAIGPGLFERIQPDRQTFCVVSVLGWCRDDRNTIKAKGGRCLAHMVSYRLLAEDEHFLLDALDVIEENLKTGEFATRGAFAWCLGNYLEALLTFYKEMVPPNFTERDVCRLCEMCFACAKDKAKIRYNAHRAIGSLFCWIPESLVDVPETGPLFEQSIKVLLNQVGSGMDFKARWNASHALGKILENQPLLLKNPNVMEPVLKQLCKVVHKSENFKERIQCVIALTKLHKRVMYGNHFRKVWHGVIESAMVPDDLQPSELAHAEKLKMEVCLAICHLLAIMEPKDLPELDIVFEESLNVLCNAQNLAVLPPERIHAVTGAMENVKLQMKCPDRTANLALLYSTLKDLINISHFDQ